MKEYEYLQIPIEYFPEEIINEYQLRSLVHNGNIYAEVRNGMYRLPQAGQIAYDKLVPILENKGYQHAVSTAGLWKDT